MTTVGRSPSLLPLCLVSYAIFAPSPTPSQTQTPCCMDASVCACDPPAAQVEPCRSPLSTLAAKRTLLVCGKLKATLVAGTLLWPTGGRDVAALQLPSRCLCTHTGLVGGRLRSMSLQHKRLSRRYCNMPFYRFVVIYLSMHLIPTLMTSDDDLTCQHVSRMWIFQCSGSSPRQTAGSQRPRLCATVCDTSTNQELARDAAGGLTAMPPRMSCPSHAVHD